MPKASTPTKLPSGEVVITATASVAGQAYSEDGRPAGSFAINRGERYTVRTGLAAVLVKDGHAVYSTPTETELAMDGSDAR
ncbi:MAG: hypothetical protein RL238_2144 [Actinomycetota bacterium]|jgi:hypothetical protein